MLNKPLAEEIHKPVIRKFEKRKVHSSFKDSIIKLKWSKFNKRIQFLLCVIDIYSKYAWVVLWKIRKVLQLLMLFKTI